MNKGSALKWAELIESGQFRLNEGWSLKEDLLSTQGGGTTHSPCGVLEDFIQQGMTRAWNGEAHWYVSRDGYALTVSADTRKRVKAKTNLTCVDDWFLQNRATVSELLDYIRDNYEVF